jgi:hypothetical protein
MRDGGGGGPKAPLRSLEESRARPASPDILTEPASSIQIQGISLRFAA